MSGSCTPYHMLQGQASGRSYTGKGHGSVLLLYQVSKIKWDKFCSSKTNPKPPKKKVSRCLSSSEGFFRRVLNMQSCTNDVSEIVCRGSCALPLQSLLSAPF